MNISSESTFCFQDSLQNLPLPGIDETVEKYLKSLHPILSNEELENVTRIANNFKISEDAQQLQSYIESKSTSTKNWLEQWWYDAYCSNRDTLLTQNMGGIIPKTFEKTGNQLEISSQIIYYVMCYWNMIRNESIKITESRGIKWDMSQFYYLFNSSRSAEFPKDKIKRWFKTEKEGNCPSHVVVLCNGYIWKIAVCDKDGTIDDISAIFKKLSYVKNNSTSFNEKQIISLTTLNRDKWAEIKAALIEYDHNNCTLFEIIDSAVFCLTLADDIVENEDELMKYSLFGSPFNSYCDKNLNIIVLRNGKSCFQAEHGNVDAIALFSPCDFASVMMSKMDSPFENPPLNVECESVEKLEIKIIDSITEIQKEAEIEFENLKRKVDVNVYHYVNFGMDYCKNLKLYADTIIQLALQIAYMKSHNKLAPTYETASTRKFYHGRTETVRSLTSESAKFINAIENGVTKDTLRTLFFDAYNAHNELMNAAKEGKGIDRHFYGLRMAQRNLQLLGKNYCNPLLDHISFAKSGGDGNFLLSTSFLGYNEDGCFGYVTPMTKDGYGCFYRINSNRITFTISNFNSDVTNASEFQENLEYALDLIKNFILK